MKQFFIYVELIKQHGQTSGYEPSPRPVDPAAARKCAHDNTTSVGAEISESNEHGASYHGVDRLERLENLIGGINARYVTGTRRAYSDASH